MTGETMGAWVRRLVADLTWNDHPVLSLKEVGTWKWELARWGNSGDPRAMDGLFAGSVWIQASLSADTFWTAQMFLPQADGGVQGIAWEPQEAVDKLRKELRGLPQPYGRMLDRAFSSTEAMNDVLRGGTDG